MIVVIGCNKGGAGKTTTAVNLAVALARRGSDVCLVDADPQRSASRWYAEREAAGLTPALTLIEKRDNITATLKTLGEKFDHVLVDVAGRNSRELITGAVIADVIIAPHQCSQLDLDTLGELQEQCERVRDLNPDLRVLAYHSMASTNPAVRETERREFLAYLAEFPSIQPLDAVGFYRKAYKDAIPNGKSVLECDNAQAAAEIDQLTKEVFGVPKPPSQTVSAKPKHVPSPAQIDAITRDLVDRPYGETQPKTKKAKPVTISLPPSLIEQLEDRALENKRAGTGPKTVSAIIREALAVSGFVNS